MYDLDCWHQGQADYQRRNVCLCEQVRRFPYERYPRHVRDVRNYAFKTLVIQDALTRHPAVLWIDSGLELRTHMGT